MNINTNFKIVDKLINFDASASISLQKVAIIVVQTRCSLLFLLHVGPTQVDRTIDLCGGPPRGTGLQNLRECIIGISTLHKGKKKLLLVLIMLPYYCSLCRDEVEIRRGPRGQAERMETDDSKLHAKVQKSHTYDHHHHLDNEHSQHHHEKVKSLILTISTIMIIVAIKG